ncbi:MAG: alternative ribosome rescue aminoacyl-tRNA hydrolase ArfB [Candidatus Sericytochromatia bacterium]
MNCLEINSRLAIPLDEIHYDYARSGGPGGQNVNKVNSKAILRFDLRQSPSLNETQRARLEEALAHRLTTQGELVLSSQEHRSQQANREAVTARFVMILQQGLRVQAPRVATKPTRSSRENRLESKLRRQVIKTKRQNNNWQRDSGW